MLLKLMLTGFIRFRKHSSKHINILFIVKCAKFHPIYGANVFEKIMIAKNVGVLKFPDPYENFIFKDIQDSQCFKKLEKRIFSVLKH